MWNLYYVPHVWESVHYVCIYMWGCVQASVKCVSTLFLGRSEFSTWKPPDQLIRWVEPELKEQDLRFDLFFFWIEQK